MLGAGLARRGGVPLRRAAAGHPPAADARRHQEAEERRAPTAAADGWQADRAMTRPVTAGYSGTPLPQKLGIKPDHVLFLDGQPAGLDLGDLPAGSRRTPPARASMDVTLTWHTTLAGLEKRLPVLFERTTHRRDGVGVLAEEGQRRGHRPRREQGARPRPRARVRRRQGGRDRRDLVGAEVRPAVAGPLTRLPLHSPGFEARRWRSSHLNHRNRRPRRAGPDGPALRLPRSASRGRVGQRSLWCRSVGGDPEPLAGQDHAGLEGVEALDAVDHVADVVLAGGGGRVGGDGPEGVAGADLDDAGGVGSARTLGGGRAGPEEDAAGQREKEAEQEDGDATATGEPDGRGALDAPGGPVGFGKKIYLIRVNRAP